MQILSVKIARPPQIQKRRNPGGADRNIDQAEPPRAAKRVADDDRDALPRELAKRGGKAPSAGVRIARKKRDDVDAGNVGLVHPGVGADKPVMRLDDQHRTAAHDAPRFPNDDFDQPRIFFQFGSELKGLGRRSDVGEFR